MDVYGRLVATVQGSLAQDAAGTWAKTVGLLLAAPELLEALDGLVREAKRLHVDDILGPGLTTARAAIEKARGGR